MSLATAMRYSEDDTLCPTTRELQELAMCRSRTVSVFTNRREAKSVFASVAAQLRAMDDEAASLVQLRHLPTMIADLDLPSSYPFALAVFLRESGISVFTTGQLMEPLAVRGPRPYLIPLAGTLTMPTGAMVLKLSSDGAQLVEIGIGQRARSIAVPGFPASPVVSAPARSALQLALDTETWVRIDSALRAVLERMRPRPLLVLAASDPLAGAFRRVTRYGRIADTGIHVDPARSTLADLAHLTYPILHEHGKRQQMEFKSHLENDLPMSRVETDRERLHAAAVVHNLEALIVELTPHAGARPRHDAGHTMQSLLGSTPNDALDALTHTALAARIPVHTFDADALPFGRSASGLLRYSRMVP